MRIILRSLLMWLPVGIAITGVIGAVAVAVQQNYRQDANDPQIQMAEDAAAALGANAAPASLLPSGTPVDIAASLAPWLAIYGANGAELVASAALQSAPPQLPAGVFDASAWTAPVIGHHFTWMTPENENRFTWQPEENVRQAVVLVRAGNGDFVAAGRSLREVEEREGQLTINMFIIWLFTMGASLLFALIVVYIKEKYAKGA